MNFYPELIGFGIGVVAIASASAWVMYRGRRVKRDFSVSEVNAIEVERRARRDA
jgi:hypothetical protein